VVDPIAIIGIGCRFPGARNPEAFWRLLREGVDAITEVPADRWNVDAFYDPTPGVPGKMTTRWGGFLEQIDQFDPQFFGISPREAMRMDPQQRLLLEVAWEALEDAGQAVERLAGTRTGVFIGISGNDYGRMQMFPGLSDAYMGTGNANSIAANRISYVSNFQGPSLTVDTACSSSLVAVHLACSSLWSGESTLALVGGVSCILSPTITINFSLAGMLSSDGRCKTFDARANGYVRGEGAGVVVLKPLSKALADADPIYAVIRGSAVNQDGHSKGLTVPSQQAQEAVMRAAYRMAGVAPGDIDYVEAHGTGTAVGDPIEASALGTVLAVDRRPGRPCAVGSVKTNIGHLEAASGIAGLIKVALSLKNREIPPSLHFREPNPQIPFHELPLRVQTALGPWPNEPRLTLAGVNSFGFGGTNAHVVLAGLEDGSSRIADDSSSSTTLHPRSLYLLPLSAHSPEALRSLAQAYQGACSAEGPESTAALRDVCYTASLRRSHLDHRLAIVVRSREELTERLEAFSRGESRPGVYSGQRKAGSHSKLVFVFTGQGSQWWAMGRQLLEQEPVFRESIEQCDQLLKSYASWSLLEELTADESRSRLGDTEIAQPALFALHVALATLWRSWGIAPDAVVGHSVGEVAAAYIAGAHGMDDAIRIIFHRGRLMQRATGQGKMAAVELSCEEAQRALAGYEDRLSVAAQNSPTSTTLSGDPRALDAVLESLQQKGVFVRTLQVNYAFHSSQMDPFLDELAEALRGLEPRAATLPMFSTVTGRPSGGQHFDAAYWVRNIRQPVLFSTAVDGLIETGHDIFVELSPHPTLLGPISKCLRHRNKEGAVLPSLRRGEAEQAEMLGTLGALYTLGYPVDWNKQYPAGGGCVRLPYYPWQRERHWLEMNQADTGIGAWLGPGGAARHPLLGRPLESALPGWEVDIDRASPPYLDDHRIQGSVLLPGTAYVEMALAAATDAFGAGPRRLAEIEFHQALVLLEGETRRVQVVLSPRADGEAAFSVYSRPKDAERPRAPWTLHASGQIHPDHVNSTRPIPASLPEIRARCQEETSVQEFYLGLRERGLEYGPSFQGIDRLWRRDGEALGRLRVPAALESDVNSYQLHPAILDACLHVMAASLQVESTGGSRRDVYLPVRIDGVRVWDRPGQCLWSHARVRPYAARDANTVEGDVRLLDETGRVLVEVSGLRVQRVVRSAMTVAEDPRDWLCKLVWEPKARAGQEFLPPDYMPRPDQIAERLRAQLARTSAQQGSLRYDQIDALGPAYILKAFQQLGWELSPGQRVATATLAERLGVASPYSRFLGRLLERLGEEGVLRRVGSEWEVCSVPVMGDPEDIRKPLLLQYPAFEAELTLIGRCGQRLADVLRGECDPLQLLFPEGSLALSERLYQDSPFVWAYNMLVQEAVSAALERLPDDRTVRILEIGGGTGGTTTYVLPKLPASRTEYVFTDVSRLFLLHGERKFREFPFVRGQLLDIERDPLEQGFDAHSFDMIYAGHVLHATSDLRQTLRRVQQLLKPDGLLVLLEGTGLHIMYDLVFAMTEGWWKFADLDLRPSHPLLSQRQWREVLDEMGFTGAAVVPEAEDGREDPSRQAVILARAPHVERKAQAAEAVSTVPERSGSWLIFTDTEGVGQGLAALLRSCGERCVMVSPSETYEASGPEHYELNPARPEDFHRLFEEALGSEEEPCRGVIHLWSLDADSSDETTLASLEAAQALVCGSVLHLVQALVKSDRTESPRLWLGTRGAQAVKGAESVSVAQSPLWGLGRVIESEQPGLHCTNVDLGSPVAPEEIQSLFEELWLGDREDQIALRGEARYVRRLVRGRSEASVEKRRVVVGAQPFRLEISTPGMLDTLTLRSTTHREPGPGEVEIQVCAAGLNFRDVMKAMGLYPAGPDEVMWLGDECAGKIVALGEGVEDLQIGDEVIATAPACFGAFATTPAAFVVAKPARLSFEEAATVPVAFLTAYYALHHLGRLGKGDRVLIHAAAGGVGLAAVQLARLAGAEIFATAGSPEKREFLQSLGIEHVMDSRSLAFADEVMERTNGEGVDVVLNSLAGEAIPKSLAVLRANGRFLEIGKRDIYQNSQLGLKYLRNNVSFFAIDLGAMFAARPDSCGTMLRHLMKEFENGTLRPLPFRVFPISDVEDAFRHMAQAKHIGKIVVSLREQEVLVADASDGATSFRTDSTFLVTGGLGGFGLKIADWMVAHGARHLVLMGRGGTGSPEAREAVETLRRDGAEVVVATGDVANPEHVARVVADIDGSMPPLRGVIHAAMVLDDASVLELNLDRLKTAMAPKMSGAWNLHTLTSNAPLDFFVLFSSAASLIGSPGQGNYVAGNAFLEGLAHYRRARSQPAMTIQWGRLTEVGYVARHEDVSERLERVGLKGFSPEQAVTMLGQLIQLNPIEMGVVRTDWSQWRKYHAAASVLLSHFVDEAAADTARDGRGVIRETLLSTEPRERPRLVESYIQRELGRVLRLDAARVDLQKPLNTLGLDSLMAVELTTRIETDLGVTFPLAALTQGSNISQLATQLLALVTASSVPAGGARSKKADARGVPPGDRAKAEDLSGNVDRLSDQEVDSLLGEMLDQDGTLNEGGR
jgi:acyl transferase domain-containing protein/acyl carrier protein